MKECVLNIQFSTIVLLLVLLSGDVAENPGPAQSGSTSDNCLSFVHLNIRSIRYKLYYVKNFLLDFNILCFTETHLTQDIESESLLLEGFSCPYRMDKTAHSSGLLTYVSNNFVSNRRVDLESSNCDAMWIEIKFESNIILICNFYRSPNTCVSF